MCIAMYFRAAFVCLTVLSLLFRGCGANTVLVSEGSEVIHFRPSVILESGEVLYSVDENGTPHVFLPIALDIADVEQYVQRLIRQGADVNHKTYKNWTALHLAVRKGNIELVRILIAAGADVDAQDYKGNTPLMMAHHYHHSDIVDLLLQHNASPYIQDYRGISTFDMMIRTEFPETIKAILYRKIPTHNVLSNAFLRAIQKGNSVIIDMLLVAGADINGIFSQVLDKSHIDSVTYYFPQIDITPLMAAVMSDDIYVVRQLLDYGADVNARNSKGYFSPLMLAIHIRNMKMIKLLLKVSDPNIQDKAGVTPLMQDALNVDITQLLLDAGANALYTDSNGFTALHYVRSSDVGDLLFGATSCNSSSTKL